MNAEMRAGLFVLATLTALVFMTMKLTQNRFSMSHSKRYYTELTDATGLFLKSKVKMAGLDVGQIQDISLIGKRVKVTLLIAGNIEVHKDSTIAIKSIGLLGDKYLELFPGTDNTPLLPEESIIAESVVAGGIEQLTAKTTQVIDNLREITDMFKQALKGTEGVDGESRLDHIVDNIEHFSEGLAAVDKIAAFAEHLNEIGENVKAVTAKINQGEGTIGKLVNDTETIDKINSTLSGVNKFVNKADKFGVSVDARSAYLSGISGVSTRANVIFQPTFDKMYVLGVTSSPRGVTAVTKTTSTTNTVATTTEERKTTETSVGINAQFGKRFGDAIVRLGLFESTGGFGVDYNFFDDRLRIVSEFYRFQKGSNAQINVGTEIHLFRPFYLWAGVDDMISNSVRNYFGGGGIRFSDQDIKSLVTAAMMGGAGR